MVWAGFAMIIVASYTANLAAFLVLDKPQTSLSGINDPRVRHYEDESTASDESDYSYVTQWRTSRTPQWRDLQWTCTSGDRSHYTYTYKLSLTVNHDRSNCPTCIAPWREPTTTIPSWPYKLFSTGNYPSPGLSNNFSFDCSSRSLKAFIWDSSRLEFEAARFATQILIEAMMTCTTVYRDCDLITAGELFGRSGYGVGLQKGSPWADKITLAILDYHESQ